MEDKTIITYSGSSLKIFEGLKSRLEDGLPNERIEWKRNFGRPSKSVAIRTKFVPLESASLSGDQRNASSLIGYPMLHTFWTDCTDVDVYKSIVKDEIANWFSTLRNAYGSSFDWMIILVEISDARKSSKLLPRTSVLDKLKSEFSQAGKQPERCVSLMDPSKFDSRSSESWQTLLHRFRLQLLNSYNKLLGRFEENMREQREKRNSQSWNFCDYFLLQEQLAFVYEMLEVYDEALVQYDELDALFSQFVLNSNIMDGPYWLTMFSSDFNNWSGLSLRTDAITNRNLRQAIAHKSPSLTDVRNYLFSRQSVMLLKLNKPWEVARRCLTFLHNVVQELSILEVPCPPGSIACWIFLSTLEVVQICELKSKQTLSSDSVDNRKSSTAHVQQYCLYTAELWAYCRKKLLELGGLCGLLPKSTPTSDQLHLVVELITGISDDYDQTIEILGKKGNSIMSGYVNNSEKDDKCMLANPAEKLKEALSSKIAFQKCYLELSESAISTYKHIGRLRSARMVGLDLANFYLELGQVQMAVTFLVDALKTFRIDSWNSLQLDTLMQVASCYEFLEDNEKLIRCCCEIICHPPSKTPAITAIQRSSMFHKMEEALKKISNPITIDGKNLLDVKSMKITPVQQKSTAESNNDIGSMQKISSDDKVVAGSQLSLQLDIESYFPATVYASIVKAALNYTEMNIVKSQTDELLDSKGIFSTNSKKQQPRRNSVQRSQSTRSNASSVTSDISCSSYSNASLPYNNMGDMDINHINSDTTNRFVDSGKNNLTEKHDLCPEADEWVDALKLREIRDYKQDRSLSAVRLVCRNSAFVLRRKDSTGSMLGSNDASIEVTKSDFKYSFSNKSNDLEENEGDDRNIILNPGRNRITLSTRAGAVGEYSIYQLSVLAFCKKLDILSQLGQNIVGSGASRSQFRVISHPVTVSVLRHLKESNTAYSDTDSNQSNDMLGKENNQANYSEVPVDKPLWAGISQIVRLSFHTGSYNFTKDSELKLECSDGLLGCQVQTPNQDTGDITLCCSSFNVQLPEAAPFTAVNVFIKVFADLNQGALNYGKNIEHTLKFSNIWLENPQNEKLTSELNSNTTLYLSFLSPINCKGKVQTAFSSKMFNVELYSTSNILKIELKNHTLKIIKPSDYDRKLRNNDPENESGSTDETSINLEPLQESKNAMFLKSSSACNYLWNIIENDVNENQSEMMDRQNIVSLVADQLNKSNNKRSAHEFLYARFEADYIVEKNCDDAQFHHSYRFIRDFEIKDFKTLYLLKTRVEPNSGGELCRASTICSLSITIELVAEIAPEHREKYSSVMYEVLTDQSEWAVCGRSAGVVNMDTARKQTVVVEVMALVGGHLPLPKVKLSKYIPADKCSDPTNQKSAVTDEDSKNVKAVMKIESNDPLVTKTSSFHNSTNNGSSSTPRMEPFASGQIFNVSHLDRVHVLPPAHPSPAMVSSSAMGNVISTNSKSTLVPTILKSVSRNPSSLSTMQPADKDSRKIGRKPSTNSSLSMSSSPSTATKQPKSLMTIIKGGHKSSVFSTSSPGTKSKSMKNEEGYELTKEDYEQLHASLP